MGNAMCPSMDGKAPVAPVKYPDPSIFFDPECAHFNGSPGDCARAKLRLIAIEHMCLAKGGTKNECEKEKELEAAKISIEQVQKQESAKKEYASQLKRCQEISAKQQTSHPRFVE